MIRKLLGALTMTSLPCFANKDSFHATDDEDSDYQQDTYKESYKDRRCRAHTQAEQKRRDAIKVRT